MTKHPVYYKTETNNYAPLDFVYNTETQAVEEISTTAPAPDLLKIVRATSTADDGNVAANVIDTDENTRWSSQGIGQKLILDMGGICSLAYMEITWYKGNERSSRADIIVDNINMGSFVSDIKVIPTKFQFPANTEGKVITIRCNGNTVNDWNSVTTVKVYGKFIQSPLPPPVGPGEEPATPGAIGKDKYGITMLNPTVTGGRTFFPPDPPPMYTAVNATKRLATTEMVAHGQGSVTPGKEYYKLAGSAPRMYMYKDDGGKDLWKNIEITCYYNRVSISTTSYAGFVMGGRSYHHLGGTTALAYYLKHHYTSKKFYLMKEQEHGGTGNKGYTDNSSTAPTSTLNGNTWYGAKLVIQTSSDGKKVRLQGYKDDTGGINGGDWKKLTERIDDGNWNTFAPFFQGPACMFRTDGVTDFRYKWFSVRAIAGF